MGKARSGDGSITKRVTKTRGTVYDVQLSVKLPNGMTKRETRRGFPTEAAAVAWRNQRGRLARLQATTKPKPLLLPDLVQQYIDASGVLPSTRKRYQSILKNHIKPRLNLRVDKLQPDDVRQFLNGTADAMVRNKKGTGASTNPLALTLIKATLRWAEDSERRLIAENPLRTARIVVKGSLNKRRALTVDEVQQLIAAASGKPSELLWRLLVSTGMRKGEVMPIQFGDIDFSTGTLQIKRIASPESDYLQAVSRTKSGKGRDVPLARGVLASIATQKLRRGAGEDDYVFPGFQGRGFVSAASIRNWWARDTRKAGLSGRVIHELRHTWATIALQNGVPVEVVSKVLGHSSPQITLSVYRDVTVVEKHSAVEVVAAAFSG